MKYENLRIGPVIYTVYLEKGMVCLSIANHCGRFDLELTSKETVGCGDNPKLSEGYIVDSNGCALFKFLMDNSEQNYSIRLLTELEEKETILIIKQDGLSQELVPE